MNQKEIINLIKNNPQELINIDKSLITEDIITELDAPEIGVIKYIFREIPKENITKKMALKLLKYEIEIYDMLPENLMDEEDIIYSVALRPAYLPNKFLHNKKAIKMLLEKWNTENSWALYEEESNFLIIKPNIKEQQYNIYLNFINYRRLEYMLVDSVGIYNENPETEAMTVMNRLSRFINHTPHTLINVLT